MGDFAYSGSDEPVLVRIGGGRRTRGDAELGEDVAHVPVHRPHAEDELGGDRFVRVPGCEMAQHYELALAQSVGVVGCGARTARVEVDEIRRRRQFCEGGASRFQLERCSVLIAQGAAGQTHQHPHPGCLVRRFELLPDLQGVAERNQRSPGVSVE